MWNKSHHWSWFCLKNQLYVQITSWRNFCIDNVRITKTFLCNDATVNYYDKFTQEPNVWELHNNNIKRSSAAMLFVPNTSSSANLCGSTTKRVCSHFPKNLWIVDLFRQKFITQQSRISRYNFFKYFFIILHEWISSMRYCRKLVYVFFKNVKIIITD